MNIPEIIITAGNRPAGMTKSRALIAATALIIILCIGCGGGGGGGGSNGTGADPDATASGVTGCYDCHADGAIAKYEDNKIFTKWRNGPHGNYEGPGDKGAPAYSELSGSGCYACHDEIDDGRLIMDYYLETGISFIGTANRPVVGCESCHDGGGSHFGIGDITANPGAEVCGKCHDSDTHTADFPESGNIYSEYRTSAHAGSISADVYVPGSLAAVRPLCSKCHTDEGAREYIKEDDYTAGYTSQDARFASERDIMNAAAVKCNTCHDAHSADKLLKPAGSVTSSEYETCAACHQNDDDAYHGVNNPEYADTSRIIFDTHSDTDDVAVNEIEGYVIDRSSERACSDCHNPHDADVTINNEWADSAHGGHILQTLNISTGKAAVTEKPWTEYDFKGQSRQACQRCHTATGFKNYANSPYDYDPVNNDYSYLAANQKELLYCWACHTNNVGALRSPGSFVSPRYITGTAAVTNGSASVTGTGTTWNTTNISVGSQFQVSGDPDVYIISAIVSTTQITLTSAFAGATAAGADYFITPYIVPAGRSVDSGTAGSAICASCHSGRQTGEFVADYPVSLTGKNFGSFNSHYLADAGIMYRTIGYEYAGQDYSDAVSYVHPTIGSTGGAEGGDGPCVGCHMKSDEGHSFEVIDGALGAVTDIKSYSNVCSRCHGSKASLIATLNTIDAQYQSALTALEGQLNGKGIYFCASYPYFKTASACGGAFFTAWPDKDTLGAAFNYNLLKNIPAAYVHNSAYTRKLIYDSIDFLDDGVLDMSVEATLGPGPATDYLGGTR